ncbi:MAG: ATP phosphoribosyltransferase regulatory subunit [Solirubrobacteraceae bacterium]|nr:ATP phosphoribosyltransferase regulatory subunit [Solirubrobacteraceae bacterium]
MEPTTTARAGDVVRLPPGSRDVLPQEARELRAISDGLRGVFEAAGFGEVITPTLEYSDVLARGVLGNPSPTYRLIDDRGAWLELRSDMTVPLARVAATRFHGHDEPLRFWYTQTAFRPVPALQGRSREVQQCGVELFGVPGYGGDREVLGLAARSLDATGLPDARIVVGDARLSATVLESAGVDAEAITAAHDALFAGDLVTLEGILLEAGLTEDRVRALGALLRTRGDASVLDAHADAFGTPGRELAETLSSLTTSEKERVIVDIGLVRDLDYYSGLVFEVVHPAIGEPIGGGGRYDGLVGKFGDDRPAVGFALNVDAVHRAQMLGATA